jgi:glycosyltransferase involved in cell wall biosynthesis
MSDDTFNIIVLIPTNNCVDRIESSIDSIINQTYDASSIKLMAIDNNSTDGTYEKLLDYSIKYGISVYRLNETCSQAMLLHNAMLYLDYINYKYITMLSPGDQFHPDYLTTCITTMEKYATAERRMLICEVDVATCIDGISSQIPIFGDNCILKNGWSLSQFFTYGLDHRIQWLCLRDTLPLNLSDLIFCVDNTDWFNKALFSFSTEIIYLKKPLASVTRPWPEDRLFELMLKLSLVTRFKLMRGVMDNVKFDVLDELDTHKIANYNLSLLALRYACDDIAENKLDSALKILLFAEMIFPDVVTDPNYADILSYVENKGHSLRKPLFDNASFYDCSAHPDSAIKLN